MKQGKGLGCKIGPAPKAWAKLEGKPVDQIYKALKLTNYVMFISARATGFRDSTDEPIAEQTT